jgi:hypothetical protein
VQPAKKENREKRRKERENPYRSASRTRGGILFLPRIHGRKLSNGDTSHSDLDRTQRCTSKPERRYRARKKQAQGLACVRTRIAAAHFRGALANANSESNYWERIRIKNKRPVVFLWQLAICATSP